MIHGHCRPIKTPADLQMHCSCQAAIPHSEAASATPIHGTVAHHHECCQQKLRRIPLAALLQT
jgi:hypothetical protein